MSAKFSPEPIHSQNTRVYGSDWVFRELSLSPILAIWRFLSALTLSICRVANSELVA